MNKSVEKILLFLLLLFKSGTSLLAQPFLKVGDKMPEVRIHNLYNYPLTDLRLKALEDKLIIIDLWSTNCPACIDKFPKMHALQKTYSDKVQVLMVNIEPRDTLNKVLHRLKRLKETTGLDFTLPFALQDTVLQKLFYFLTIPHIVWIKNGRVAAITDSDSITDENIQAAVNNQLVSFVKNDSLQYSEDKKLLVNGVGGGPGDFIYRTLFTAGDPRLGAPGGFVTDSLDRVIKIFQTNMPLWQMLQMSHPELFGHDVKALINESGTDIYKRYSYEAYVPPLPLDKAHGYMATDLAEHFHVDIKSDYRIIDVYLLRPLPVYTKDRPKTGKDTMRVLLSQIASKTGNIINGPVILDTEYTPDRNVMMPVAYEKLDSAAIISLLQKKGYRLTAARRLMPVMVYYNVSKDIQGIPLPAKLPVRSAGIQRTYRFYKFKQVSTGVHTIASHLVLTPIAGPF